MALNPTTALSGYNNDFGNVTLNEVTGKALVSIAVSAGNKMRLSKALQKGFGLKIPKVGSSTNSGNGKSTLLGMQSDQMFMLFDHDSNEGHEAVTLVTTKLGDAGYYTDQSDSWTMIEISGEGARPALERICMIDLHQKAFRVGSFARTTMEHLGTIIYLPSKDSFLVMGARSSAKSLLHALEVSIQNTA